LTPEVEVVVDPRCSEGTRPLIRSQTCSEHFALQGDGGGNILLVCRISEFVGIIAPNILLESHGGLRCNDEAGNGKALQEAVMSKRRQADHQNKIVMNFERDLFMAVGMILIEERGIVILGALCDPRRSPLHCLYQQTR